MNSNTSPLSQLPPLPESAWHPQVFERAFSVEQMHAYARAALEAEVSSLRGEPAAWRWRFRDAMDSRWRLQNKEPSGDPATFEIEPLYASPPSQPIALRHATNEFGDCPHWCKACEVEAALRQPIASDVVAAPYVDGGMEHMVWRACVHASLDYQARDRVVERFRALYLYAKAFGAAQGAQS